MESHKREIVEHVNQMLWIESESHDIRFNRRENLKNMTLREACCPVMGGEEDDEDEEEEE